MNQQRPRFTNSLQLAAVLTAPACARMFVRSTLTEWGLKDVIETAELLTSELVTNAIKATGVVDHQPTWPELEAAGLALLRVSLYGSDSDLVIEVADTDPSRPVLQEPSLDADSGRGLMLVKLMARRWSYYNPPTGGKVVWCEIPRQGEVTS